MHPKKRALTPAQMMKRDAGAVAKVLKHLEAHLEPWVMAQWLLGIGVLYLNRGPGLEDRLVVALVEQRREGLITRVATVFAAEIPPMPYSIIVAELWDDAVNDIDAAGTVGPMKRIKLGNWGNDIEYDGAQGRFGL